MDIKIAKISRKGQVVIPASIRKSLGLEPSDSFIVFGKGDTILFKKIEKTALEKGFEEIAGPLQREVEKSGLKREHLEEIIEGSRAKK